jgi:hypothetical protein
LEVLIKPTAKAADFNRFQLSRTLNLQNGARQLIMKKIKYVVLAVAIVFGESSIAQVKQLYAARIEAKSIAIKKMIERHNSIADGLVAFAVLYQVALFAPVFTAGFNNFFDKPACICKPQALVKPVYLPFFTALSNGFKDLFFTSNGLQELLKMSVSNITANFILGKVIPVFRHSDTLRWYVHAHVPYVRAIQTIKSLTVKLQVNDLNAQDRDHYHSVLYACCDRLSGYGEDVCAYMVYKSSELEGRAAEMAERMARYLLNSQNEALGSIGNELDKQTPDYQIVKQLITVYESEMRSHRDMFAVIEGELQ